MWQFNRSTGFLESSIDTPQSLKTKDDYWTPVKGTTFIEDDRLVITIEGTSLKPNLPEVRGGSTVPFWFQFHEYDPAIDGYYLRQRENVTLTFHDNPNACNLPKECESLVEEEEGAMSLTTSMGAIAASVVTLASLLSF